MADESELGVKGGWTCKLCDASILIVRPLVEGKDPLAMAAKWTDDEIEAYKMFHMTHVHKK